MRLDTFMIGFLLFSLIVMSFSGMIISVDTNYDASLNTSMFSDAMNTTSQMTSTAEDMKNKTFDADISETDSWESMTKGSYSAVRLSKDSMALSSQMMEEANEQIGMPSYIVTIFTAIIVIALVFSVIYMIFRFKP